MIFIILGFVLGAIFGWKLLMANNWDKEFVDYIFATMLSLITGAVGSMIGLLIALGAGCFFPSEYVLENRIEIVALKDNNGVSGNFFLGCGSIKNGMYYFFYVKRGDAIIFNKIEADSNVELYEESRKDGLIKVYEKDFKKKSSFWLGMVGGSTKYKIYIPEESIKRNFELNLE